MSRTPIVLIHGSWHWGGCFQKVADRLATMGFAVATPDLASHGYSDVAWDAVSAMQDYTAPIGELLARLDAPAVLVGHSMGGVSLSYLAETVPQKIKTLVYLTAFMTPVGKTANDYIFSYAENPVAAALFKVLEPVNDGAGLKLDLANPAAVRDAFYGDCFDADVRVAAHNAVEINTSVPNVYAPSAISDLPRHYITCADDHAIPLSVQQQMIEAVPGAKVHAMTTSHSPFFSQPDRLAALIGEIANG